MLVALVEDVYNVGIAGQPPHRLTGVVPFGWPADAMYWLIRLAKGSPQHMAWNLLFLFE